MNRLIKAHRVAVTDEKVLVGIGDKAASTNYLSESASGGRFTIFLDGARPAISGSLSIPSVPPRRGQAAKGSASGSAVLFTGQVKPTVVSAEGRTMARETTKVRWTLVEHGLVHVMPPVSIGHSQDADRELANFLVNRGSIAILLFLSERRQAPLQELEREFQSIDVLRIVFGLEQRALTRITHKIPRFSRDKAVRYTANPDIRLTEFGHQVVAKLMRSSKSA